MAHVTVRPAGIEFTAEPGQTIMAAGEAAGYRWPTICGGVGDCHACHVEVLDSPEHLGPPNACEQKAIETLNRGDRVRLACQAAVHGDVVVLKRGVRGRKCGEAGGDMSIDVLDPTSMTLTDTGIRLIGGRCEACGEIGFPCQDFCRRCGADGVVSHELTDRGVLWSWTVQRYQPPSPPYTAPAGEFEPFAVGYVELPGEVIVETLLTVTDGLRIGMPMRLTRHDVTCETGGRAATFAFAPDEEQP